MKVKNNNKKIKIQFDNFVCDFILWKKYFSKLKCGKTKLVPFNCHTNTRAIEEDPLELLRSPSKLPLKLQSEAS